jgi:hypothetical protein
VRTEARDALRDSPWSPAVVEAALENALWDLDETRAAVLSRDRAGVDARPVLVVLPGNIIGPAIVSAFCAAAAGASVILKSPGRERRLAGVVAGQFDALGPPLAGTLDARYWAGGSVDVEDDMFARVRRAIVFGSDDTVETVRRRAAGVDVVAYGDAFSIGFVPGDVDLDTAAGAASTDVAMFDQRGCMSPQTIYVQGDEGRALQFARLLAGRLERAKVDLPRAAAEPDEAALAADFVRRLSVLALAPKTHGLDTIVVGRSGGREDRCPDYVVAVAPFGSPIRPGFGRIAIVMPCDVPGRVTEAVAPFARGLDTIGIASDAEPLTIPVDLRQAHAGRFCRLGSMQRPPFGYRPAIGDFA